MALVDRRIPLEACFNLRDLGGHETSDGRRVRFGVLYRADTLHRLTANDLDMLRNLELCTVIDLRTQSELDRHGRARLADQDEVAHHHLPMVDELRSTDAMPEEAPTPEQRGERYLRMLEQAGPAVVGAMRLLADAEALPAVFHCTAGKDRTGVSPRWCSASSASRTKRLPTTTPSPSSPWTRPWRGSKPTIPSSRPPTPPIPRGCGTPAPRSCSPSSPASALSTARSRTSSATSASTLPPSTA